MCGIFGWALPQSRKGDEALLARLTGLMLHRGPDGDGYWLEPTADGAHQIGFGHRRLAIIDPAGGAQPMWSGDGALAIIQNGEIYNYVELREELATRGHRFTTKSDTEVLLEAYRAWGIGALGRLRGMFALALWDSREQQLILARDPFGKKPLFITEQQQGLVFASEIEPLLGYPGVSRAIEPQGLQHYLLNRYVPAPLTFFRAVRKLPPGCALVWKHGNYSITRYFTPPLAQSDPDIGNFDSAVHQFEAIFAESVRLRMRSDAPYGAFLSGGIDSSAVVAQMAQHTSPVRTFSVGFREAEWSELNHAKAIASLFCTDHRELVVEPETFLAHWPLAVRRRAAPVSEASDVPIFMLSQLARQSVKMVLTGEGSDEILGGYPKHRAEPWAALYQQLMPGPLHDRIARGAARPRLRILAGALGERDQAMRQRAWFGGISALERTALVHNGGPLSPPDPFPFAIESSSALRRTLYFDQTSWLPDNLLERGDRMMMAGSIEGRMPFMDVELARFAARLPDWFLAGGRGGKRVLRAAMKRHLPEAILSRRKIGFRVPLADWFRDRYRDQLRDLLASESSWTAQLCNRAALKTFLAEHLDGRRNNERLLWTLANLELFLRAFRPDGIEAMEASRRVA